jgi:replicative DNA helicase
MQEQDTLQFYGTGFQNKVLAVLIKDRTFLQQIHDIIDPKYFSSESAQWIASTVLKYFAQYKTPPTLEALKVYLDEVDVPLLKTTVVENLKEVIRYADSTDLDFTKDRTLEFCKNQKIKAAILESVQLLQVGKYDDIKTAIDEAMKAGTDRNVGHEYLEDIAARFVENKRNTIPTPWDVINEIMDGGLGSGEMGVFVAPAGIGKSMALVNIAAGAVKAGLNVVYYSLELSETYVGARFDSHYTGIPNQDLKFHQEEVIEKLEKLKGRLIIKYYPTKTATVTMLAAHLDKCTMQGFNPDLVIVDYADLLRDTSSKGAVRNDIMLGNIYEDLRGMAGTYQIPVYTASQANRSALEEDIIEADKIAESYSKVMVADFVVSLSRKVADKISGTGRWHIIKNRFGPDGLTFPSKMNMAVSKIDIYAENTILGKEAKGLMQNDSEVVRKALANKFSELNSFSK